MRKLESCSGKLGRTHDRKHRGQLFGVAGKSATLLDRPPLYLDHAVGRTTARSSDRSRGGDHLRGAQRGAALFQRGAPQAAAGKRTKNVRRARLARFQSHRTSQTGVLGRFWD